MTRRAGRPRGGAARPATDPYGIGPAGSLVAPVLAVVGLTVIALITVALFTGSVPLPGGGGSRPQGSGGGIAPNRTPAPSNVVIVDPRTNIPGTLVFVKQGNLWTQTGNKAVQITTSGAGSMPSWSADGQWIYYIESIHDQGLLFPVAARAPAATDGLPEIRTSVRHPDATEAQKRLLSGGYKQGQCHLFFSIRRTRISAGAAKTVALVSDGPDPTKSDVVLQTYDVTTKKTKRLGSSLRTHRQVI